MYERCEAIIRGWDQWSPAELAKMDDLVEEVMDHIINGGGNRFVREFVNRVVVPLIPGMVAR